MNRLDQEIQIIKKKIADIKTSSMLPEEAAQQHDYLTNRLNELKHLL